MDNHMFLDSDEYGNMVFKCEACDDETVLVMPCRCNMFDRFITSYISLHSECKEEES